MASEGGCASADLRDGAVLLNEHKQERTPSKEHGAKVEAEEAAAGDLKPGVILEVRPLPHLQHSPEHQYKSMTLQPECTSLILLQSLECNASPR